MNEQIIYAISALVAALSFAALCVYLIRTLVSARKTLGSLQTTLAEAGGTVEAIRGTVQELAENVNEISINVKEKLHAADALFQAAKDAGETVRETTQAAKEISGTLAKTVREQAADTDKPWMSWIKLGLNVFAAVRQSLKAGSGDGALAARPGRPARTAR